MCEGWGHEVSLQSDQNYQPGHFLSSCFFLGGRLFFLPTISHISHALCLRVSQGDGGGSGGVNAQEVSLLSRFTFADSSSPLNPFSHLSSPSNSPLLPARNGAALISSPLFYLPSSSLPLYLPISLTLPPPLLSHLSLLHWFVDSCGTEHKSILFITPRCTLHNPNRLFPLTQWKGTHTQIGLVQHWRIGTHMRRQTSKQSAAREQCVDSQLILILWLCTIQYFFLLLLRHEDKLKSQRQKKCLRARKNKTAAATQVLCCLSPKMTDAIRGMDSPCKAE